MKQLNLHSDISNFDLINQCMGYNSLGLENDMMALLKRVAPYWEFGAYQDIDEFFKLIYVYFSVDFGYLFGYEAVEVLETVGPERSVINNGLYISEPMLTVKLPQTKSKRDLFLPDLINQTLKGAEFRDYKMFREYNAGYFERNHISWDKEVITVKAQSRKYDHNFKDILPIFIARRTKYTNSKERDFRNDRIIIPDTLVLDLNNDGTRVEFILVSVAIYIPGHYNALTKSYPDRIWLRYDDSRVEKLKAEKIIEETADKAVMVFYVRKSRSVETPIPQNVRNLALIRMMNQHIIEEIVKQIP